MRDPETGVSLRLLGPESMWFDPFPHEVVTLTPARLLGWTAKEIDTLVDRQSGLASALIEMQQQDLRISRGRIAEYADKSIRLRVWQALLDLAKAYGRGPDGSLVGRRVEMTWITHQLLSEYVGTTREVVSHHMNYFSDHGFLRYKRGRFEILNPTLPSPQTVEEKA